MNSFLLLLQISVQETEVAVSQPVTSTSTESISLIDLLMKGGIIMLPIFLLSFLAIYVIVERFITIKKASASPDNLLESIKPLLLNGEIAAAEATLSRYSGSTSLLLGKGIKKIGSPIKQIETTLENTGRIEILKLERKLGILHIVASIAPMLGFVGTISGVIKIFYNISLADNISIGLIAGGLYEKMVTSATGLIVGIIAYAGYHYLNMMIEKLSFQMESSAVELIELISDGSK